MSASGASVSASKHKASEKATELTRDFYEKAEEENKPQSTGHVATQADSQAIYVRHNTALLYPLNFPSGILPRRRRRRNSLLPVQ